MPTIKLLSACALLAAILTSCVPTLNPLIPNDQAITDPRIVGAWVEDTGKPTPNESYELRPAGKHYLLIHTEGNTTNRFRAVLGKLDDRHYLDCTPDPDFQSGTELLKTTSISAHMFFQVRFESGKPRLNVLNSSWLERMLKQGKVNLPHASIGEGTRKSILLLAPTAQLQAFIRQYANDAEAFSLSDPMKLKTR